VAYQLRLKVRGNWSGVMSLNINLMMRSRSPSRPRIAEQPAFLSIKGTTQSLSHWIGKCYRESDWTRVIPRALSRYQHRHGCR